MNRNSGGRLRLWGCTTKKIHLETSQNPYIMMWQYCTGNNKPKKAGRLILNAFKKLLQNLKKKKNYLTEFSDWLTACLPACPPASPPARLPASSDLRYSTMARATGLIFSLFDVVSAREVPFAIPLYMQWILHGLTTTLLCVPFIFVHHEKCRFSGRNMMASICYRNCL